MYLKILLFLQFVQEKQDSNEDLNDFEQWKRKNRSKWWWVRSLIKSSTRTWPPTPATLTNATRWGLYKNPSERWIFLAGKKDSLMNFVCFNGKDLLNMKVIWDLLVDSIPSDILWTVILWSPHVPKKAAFAVLDVNKDCFELLWWVEVSRFDQ